jgi:Domain of unknown function (DUF4432)
MPKLFGRSFDRREFERHVGAARQTFGVDLVELADGAERGVRALLFRTGGGLEFSVLVDRTMDIGRFDFRGVPFAWQSATGFRAPAYLDLPDENGAGFLRGFSGLLCTCGFDHTRQADRGPADHFDLPLRKEIAYPMHGRGAFQPARLHGYGVRWEGDDAFLWCEGAVDQAAVFGENLAFTRRIEARAGEASVKIVDTIANRGFSRTPHMLLYHINAGFPLLDEGARFAAPIRATMAANMPRESQQAGWRTQPGPASRFVQQVFDHDAAADAAGIVPTALINDRLGLGFAVEYERAKFPCLQEWQGLADGIYGFGIEPATSRWRDRAGAASRNEIVWLDHGESRTYTSVFRALDGAAAIAAFDARVAAIHPTVPDEFPARADQPPGGPFVSTLPRKR